MPKISSSTQTNSESDIDFKKSFHAPSTAGQAVEVEIESDETNSGQEPPKRPSVGEKLELLSKQLPRNKTAFEPTSASCLVPRRITFSKVNLTENLLRHLNVGSRDSLNLMIDIFEFHGYEKTLLNNYVANKSLDNLQSLETQIKNFPI